MPNIEGSPFDGQFRSFGIKSSDSITGILDTSRISENPVIKWSRKNFTTPEEACSSAEFLKKTIDLSRVALGNEFIAPTEIVVGNKIDNGRSKIKIYIIQKYLDGWTAKDAPEEIRNNELVQEQWSRLNEKLFILYNSAHFINQQADANEQFPITITLGSSRRELLEGRIGLPLPQTPNLLIQRSDLQLSICDFGPYTQWHEGMENSYNSILKRVTK